MTRRFPGGGFYRDRIGFALDVDMQSLKEYGVIAAKEAITMEQYHKLENQSEKKVYESRDPGVDLARRLLD